MHIRDRLSPRPFKDLIAEGIQNRAAGAGLSVRNEDGKAVVRIYDVIGWPFIEAQNVAAALDEITADEIEVQINSPGGDAFEGVAIYNALRSHPAKVTTRVDGLAASAASVIAQAGDHRVMLSGAQMMIHDAWALAIGNAQVMHETGDVLDKLSENLAEIYADRSGKDGFRDQMRAEAWFTHDEAVEAGLADESVKPNKSARAALNPPNKFVDELGEAVAAFESATARAAEVITLRSEQGRPPLSDEAVALVDRAAEALSRLKDTDGAVASGDTAAKSDTETSPVVSEIATRLLEKEPEWITSIQKELDHGADASTAR